MVESFLLAAVLFFGGQPVAADDFGTSSAVDGSPVSILPGLQTCDPTFESSLSKGSRCMAGWAFNNHLLDPMTRFVNEQGRPLFDEHFRFVNSMSFSSSGSRLNGTFHFVLPLVSSTYTDAASSKAGAFFIQPGMTRWIDNDGIGRSDFHLGTVRRFVNSGDTVLPGVVGLYAFIQQNSEFRHQRFVVGADYAGKWGRGYLNLFVPKTGWLAAQTGYEERALAGSELGMQLDLTTTISMRTSVAHWERDDGLGGRSKSQQVAFGWRPHPWLDIAVTWNGIGTRNEDRAIRVSLSMPLGGRRNTPGWEGLGVVADRSRNPVPDLWNPVENFEGIKVARRKAVNDYLVSEASVRFLQDSASTGDLISLEVRLPSAPSGDLDLIVTLSPGTGDNPAVPGVDFVDEPIPVTVRAGTTSAVVTVQLPLNSDLNETRSLQATVALAG